MVEHLTYAFYGETCLGDHGVVQNETVLYGGQFPVKPGNAQELDGKAPEQHLPIHHRVVHHSVKGVLVKEL